MGTESESMPKKSFRRIGDCKTPSFLCSSERSLRETSKFLTIRGAFCIFRVTERTNYVFENSIWEISAKIGIDPGPHSPHRIESPHNIWPFHLLVMGLSPYFTNNLLVILEIPGYGGYHLLIIITCYSNRWLVQSLYMPAGRPVRHVSCRK